ncbi:hypothetical protein [Heyndrickxia sporothermodurans]|uniref:hypothetical protein n=1 Tax=Heyndrickxia sporothermodurans TaxID=46224 RepID=UPI000D361471|nr:hypothetical protein [Heyndrickxia sporothermodurans]PTY89740.1 hypothetical protein B5V90_07425 [Heyndrickxia sporothermodurans]
MKHTVFVGYDIPLALEIKHDMVIPLLDKEFKRIELEGDIVHLVEGESSIKFIGEMISAFNAYYDIGLTLDIEPYHMAS